MSLFNSRTWLPYASLKASIACPELRLLGRPGELIVGAGSIHRDEWGEFQFEMEGTSPSLENLQQFRQLQRENPYDGLWRFRLTAVDESSQELHCGFVSEENLKPSQSGIWSVSGEIEGLSLDAPSTGTVGSEILVLVPDRHWLRHVLDWSFPPANEAGFNRYAMRIQQSKLEFEYERKSRSLAIAITGSDLFPQTFTENWLSEPLRMMTGHLVFPRIIVRANPDRAIVKVTQVRGWHREGDGYSLFDPATAFKNPQLFFQMYAELLEFVAGARNASGERNHVRHRLTEFYEELAQAMRGSRWIMTLTLASAIEGAMDILFPLEAKDESADPEELNSLKNHIGNWQGHLTSTTASKDLLKGLAKGAVSRAANLTAIKRLRQLERKGLIARKELDAWDKVRNKVAHGNIFSPFSSSENDEVVMCLMSLFRKIAGQIALGRNPPEGEPPERVTIHFRTVS